MANTKAQGSPSSRVSVNQVDAETESKINNVLDHVNSKGNPPHNYKGGRVFDDAKNTLRDDSYAVSTLT